MKKMFCLLFAAMISASAVGCGGQESYEVPEVNEDESKQHQQDYKQQMQGMQKGGQGQ